MQSYLVYQQANETYTTIIQDQEDPQRNTWAEQTHLPT
jgi:hypothetical protein